MKILDKQPVSDKESTILLPDGSPYLVKPYQVIVWVSLDVRGRLRGPIPAFLDSGHNHNFSITERHLRSWCDVPLDSLPGMKGFIRINGREHRLKAVDVLLHHNVPGMVVPDPLKTFRLGLSSDRGIAVMDVSHPPLPILGIRSLFRNGLTLRFDGRKNRVTLQRGWF